MTDDIWSDGIARYTAASKSPNTLALYAKVYASFTQWCRSHGFDATRPDSLTIARYLVVGAEKWATSTIRVHLAGVLYALRRSGYRIDENDVLIQDTMAGIERLNQKGKRQAAAITLEDVRKLLNVCPDTMVGSRDRALLLVGFAGAFRRAELMAIDVEHIRWSASGMVIAVPRSKEDQAGIGADVSIPYGSLPQTCPVRALQAWLERADITAGPIFRPLMKNGNVRPQRLSDKQVCRTLAARADQAGIVAPAGRTLSSHGLRAGFITEAHKAGVLDEEIMGHTRHRAVRVMRSYVRRERLNTASPAGRIGL